VTGEGLVEGLAGARRIRSVPLAPDPLDRLFVLRLSGEIYVKARQTRLRFLRRLEANLRDALSSAGIPHRLERTWSRFYLETSAAAAPEAPAVVARVFGIQSLSAVERRSWSSLDDLVSAGAEYFRPAVAGRRFAVRASRRGSRGGSRGAIPFDSTAVENALGRALLAGSGGVDLGAPEVTARVEVEPGVTHLFFDKIAARGGLPVGVEGRALALVSGGFDSAVAAWLLLKRGVKLDYLLCNLGGEVHRAGALAVLRVLAERWSYGTRPRLYEVDLEASVAHLKEKAWPQLWQVLLKRMMLRAGEAVAGRLGAPALATGDSIGQVSSQTLQNLAVVSQATSLPVLRPLVGANKEEILALARDIGIYEKAAAVAEFCGLAHRRPATRASLSSVLAGEAALETGLLAAALEARTSVDLRSLGEREAGATGPAGRTETMERTAPAGPVAEPPAPSPPLDIDSIDPAATVIDLRPAEAFQTWHWPGAVRLDLPRALAACAALPKGTTYVVVCEVGWKSAHLVERMREAGLAAFLFKGGSKGLMRLAERERLAEPALLAPAVRERP
jgi:tRNA uracil 4-sulfurtransferase